MKKILYFLAGVAILFAPTACEKDVVSGLSDGSDVRVAKMIADWRSELTGAENGWMLNLSTSKGVYRFWMDFTPADSVLTYTDNLAYPDLKTTPEWSTWRIEAYRAPTLIFEEYSYIHIVNDPDNSVSGGIDNEGLQTDFEFEIVEYVDDQFILKGRMNKVPATLIRASSTEFSDVKAGRMMDQLNAISTYAAGRKLQFDVGADKVVSVILKERSTTMITVNTGSGGDVEVNQVDTYVEMGTGDIVFTTPVVVGDVSFSGLKWNEEDQSYDLFESSVGTYELAEVEEFAFPIHKVFGLEKPFARLRYYDDAALYNSLSALGSANPILSGISTNYFLVMLGLANAGLNLLEWGIGGDFLYSDVYFEYGDEPGRYKLVLQIDALLEATTGAMMVFTMQYKYDVTFSETDPSLFTVGQTFTTNPIGEQVYGPGLLNCSKVYVDAFAGKTFQMDWSTVKFGAEFMGELRHVVVDPDSGEITAPATPTIFLGGLTQ